MGRDEGIEIASANINLAPELAESNPAFITVFLKLPGADAKLLAQLLAGQVLILTHTTDLASSSRTQLIRSALSCLKSSSVINFTSIFVFFAAAKLEKRNHAATTNMLIIK